MIGFVMTRHVNSSSSNRYWNESYRRIRKYYPHAMVMIIDDDSNYDYVRLEDDIQLTNVMIIQSEFPHAGEILAYYYFYRYHPFEKAVVMHDSVFFQQAIDFSEMEGVRYLWHFTPHHFDNPHTETMLLGLLENHEELVEFYHQKHLWYGCFGAQAVIHYDLLHSLVEKHKIFRIIPHIAGREERYAIERISGCLFTYAQRDLGQNPSFFGCIYHYMPWGYTFDEYDNANRTHEKPLVKVWTRR